MQSKETNPPAAAMQPDLAEFIPLPKATPNIKRPRQHLHQRPLSELEERPSSELDEHRAPSEKEQTAARRGLLALEQIMRLDAGIPGALLQQVAPADLTSLLPFVDPSLDAPTKQGIVAVLMGPHPLPADLPTPVMVGLARTILAASGIAFLPKQRQCEGVAAPFAAAVAQLSFGGSLLPALDKTAFPGLSEGLESARKRWLHRSPVCTLLALRGSLPPPSTPEGIFAVRVVAIGLLAPILAHHLAPFATGRRVSVATATSFLWGDELDSLANLT